MARPARPRTGASLWVFVVLVAALAIGGAAALLTGPVAPTVPTYVYAPFDITANEAGWLVIGFVVVWLVAHLLERRQSGTALLPGRVISVALLAILLAVAFVFIARFAGSAVGNGGGDQSASGGATVPPSATLNNTTANLTKNTTAFQPFHVGGWSVPGWVVLAALFGVAAVVGLVALPLYLSSRRAAAPRPPDASAGARSDLGAALGALDDLNDADVRRVIITLYARLLARMVPVLGDVEPRSPRELERACVERFHIRSETARALTELFEEARYSTHPLDAATGARARDTFRRALADLDAPTWRAS